MIRTCQRCDLPYPECHCPTFKGEERMECKRCGALHGQHLVDFTDHPDGEDRLICPPPVQESRRAEGLWMGGDPFCEHTGPDDNGFCITCGASHEEDS